MTSKKEYMRNKVQKRTNVIDVKPEPLGMVDKRMAEKDFYATEMRSKSFVVANNAKSMRLNRRQMFKNAPLEDSYEPVIMTKQVLAPLMAPEVDLPALK